MKNLESKYIDLANFYKKELVSKRDQSPIRNNLEDQLQRRQTLGQQTHSSQNKKSPYYQQQVPELDQNVENSIINELLLEKNDLEKELENMIHLQGQHYQNEQNIFDRMQDIQNENKELKELVNLLNHEQVNEVGEGQVNKQDSQQEIKYQQELVIDKFEQEFIVFINSNYNSFTENDVIGMFGNLKNKLYTIVQKVLKNNTSSQQILQKANINLSDKQDLQQIQISLDQLQQEIQNSLEQYKVDLTEFEIQHEYTLQNLNKIIFDFKNKNDISKLDLKKINLTLSTLGKNASDLNFYIQPDSNKRSFNIGFPSSSAGFQQQDGTNIQSNIGHSRGFSGQRKSIIDSRQSLQQSKIPPMSPSSQNIQQRISGEMQQQVQVMSQTIQDLTQKMGSGDKDFKNFSILEEQSQDNLKLLKDNFEKFQEHVNSLFMTDNLKIDKFIQKDKNIISLNSEKNSLSKNEFIRIHGDDDQPQVLQQDHSKRQIQELQNINNKLQNELQISQEKFNYLKNQHKQTVTDNNKLRNSVSPNRFYQNQQIELNNMRLSNNYDNNIENNSGPRSIQNFNNAEEIYKLKDKLKILEQENSDLERNNRKFLKQLDNQSENMEKLQQEVEHLKVQNSINAQNQRSLETNHSYNVQNDQLIFYQQYADNMLVKIKNFMKYTSKFLSSMKKLQKAVHKKEVNVQMEKNEFEQNRKELESFLKQLKKDIESQDNYVQDFQKNQQNQNQIYKSDQQLNSNYSSKINYNPPIQNQKNFNKHNTNSLSTKPNAQSFNIQGNNFSMNNNVGNNFTLQEAEHYRQSYNNLRQKERSPIPLRQNLMNTSGPKQVEMFRSLETAERKPLLQSIDRQQRSPSENYHSSSQQKQNSIENSNQRQYLNNMKSEIDLLKQEVLDLINERDHMRKTIQRFDREKDEIISEKIILEKYIDREKKKYESSQREINDLEKEKQTLLQEFKKISQNYMGQPQMDSKKQQIIDNSQLQKIQEQKQILEDKLDIQLKMNQEYKRTIQILEESADVAKQAIIDLKEALSSKDIEIQELQFKMNVQKEQIPNNKASNFNFEQEIRKIKTEILEQISQQCDENDEKLRVMQQDLDQKDEEINKIKRNLDRKIKEKEMQRVNESEQEVKAKLLQLQNQIKEMEKKENFEEEEKVQQLKKQIENKNKQIQEIENKFSNDKKKLENQIQQLKEKHKKEFDEFKQQEQININQISGQQQLQLQQKQQQLNDLNLQYQQDIKNKENNNQQLQNQKDQLLQQVQKLQNQINELSNQKIKEQKDIQNQIDDFQKQIIKLENQIVDKDTQNKDLQKQLFQVSKQSQQLSDELQQNLRDFETNSNMELEKKTKEIKKLKESIQQQQTQNNEQMKIQNKQIQDLQQEKMVLEQQQQEFIDQIGSEKGEVMKQKEQEIAQIKQKLQNNKKQHDIEIQSKDHEISQNNNDYNTLKEEYMLLQEQIGQLNTQMNQQIEAKSKQIKQIQEKQNLDQQENQKIIKEKDQQIKIKDQEIKQIRDDIQKQNNLSQNELQTKNQQLSEIQVQSQKQIQAKDEQINKYHHDFENKEKLISQQKNQIDNFSQEIKQKAIQLQELQSSNKQYEIDIKNLQIQQQQTSQQFQSLNEQERQKLQQELENQKQQLLNEQQVQQQKFILEQQNEKEKLKKQLNEQNQQIQNELENANKKILQQEQNMKDMENENKYVKAMQNSLKKQFESRQKEMEEEKEKESEEKKSFEQQCSDLKMKLEKKDQQLQNYVQQFQQLQQQINQQDDSYNKLQKNLEQSQNESKQKLLQKDHEIQQKHQELLDLQDSKDQQIQTLIEEKDQAFKQLSEIVNQSKFENKSLEEKLQNQLHDTLKNLQNKEKELSQRNQKLYELEKQIKEQQSLEEMLQDQNSQYAQQLEQNQQELDNAENTRQKHQLTLENNRNLIQMLKNELQKNIEKQRQQQQEQDQQISSKDAELKEENEALKQRLHTLKSEFEDKMTDLQMKIDEKESEYKIQNELIEEANKVIEEFNDEKHDIKAKFKHLVQILDENNEESSYKEDDQIELEECFDKLEREIIRFKNRKEQQMQILEHDNTFLQEQQKLKDEELQQLQTQMSEVKCELMNALNKCDENDLQIRKKMEIAERKIENYKEKLIEKQKYLNTLEIDRNKQSIENDKNIQKGENSMMQENIDLIQKLQKAENELQTYRLSSSRKQPLNESYQEQASQDNIQKVKSIEEQIDSLRKQIFNAKDQVILNISDTFAKKIKDLQQMYQNENILKQKLAELNENQIQQPNINLNTQLKFVVRVNLGNKNLIIIYNENNKTYQLLDQQLLSYTQLEYINSFVPDIEQDEIQFDSKQIQIMKNLQDQINEMRDERQEIKNELIQFKSKISQGKGLDDIQEMRMTEMEDDLGHLGVENQELRQNIKELSQKNAQLRLRIIELNQYLSQHLTGEESQTNNNMKKILQLHQENDQLKQQLQRKVSGFEMEEEVKMRLEGENSFLGDMKHGDNQYFLDQSSIEGVIEGLNGNNAINTEQQIRPSKIQLQQKVKKLERELEDFQTRTKNLTAELQRSQQQTLNPSEASVIDHIKGTLIQFLKHCPLTEKNNEELLAIVFSMMEFSKEEIQDVQTFRQKIKDSSQSGTEPDEEIKKLAKKGIFNIFKKKEKEKEQKIKGNSNQGTPQSNSQFTSPIRPIKR